MKRIKIFSFFSGSGFLDLGFEKAGYNIEFVNEFSSTFLNAYIYSRAQMNMKKPMYGYWATDINDYLVSRRNELKKYIFDAKQDGSLIGFIGGPPCPDFSVAGKNRGKHGDNGRLSSSYVNLIIDMKPDFFLFENVKGLWKTARHREFYEELKRKLQIAGYCTTDRLTNALEFGVPQDRERILLIGIKNSKLLCNQVNGNELVGFPWTQKRKYTMEQIKEIDWPTNDIFIQNGILPCPVNIIKELTVEYWFEKNDVTNHPDSGKHFVPRKGLVKMQTINEGDVSKKCYKRLHRWRYSPTAAYGNNEVHLHPYKCRRLSASEALAIQSLPKEFILPIDMSLSDMFKTIGNGVPFLLSKAIANSLQDYLEVSIK
ncbi:MAG: DNA cytosine methyltransferase [Clostridiales bacterium]|nr:DNA cytosine methyltransferase [Clostridiales bacterium]